MHEYNAKYIYVLLFGILFIFWALFQIINPHSYSNGDTGAIFVYSKLVIEEHSLLASDYYYPTELRFLWPSTFYIPFFYIFNDYGYIRLFANISMYIVLFLTLIYAIKQYNIDKTYAFLAMALIFIPVSNHYLYVSILASFYTIYYIIYIAYFALLLKIIYTNTRNKWTYIALYILLIFIGSLNGIKVLTYMFIPLLCASIMLLIIYRLFKKDYNITVKYITYSFVGFMASLLGYLVNDKIFRKFVNFTEFTDSKFFHFNITEQILKRALNHIEHIFYVRFWDNFASILSNVSLFLSIILFIYILYYMLRNIQNTRVTFLIIFFIILIIEQVALIIFFKGYKPKYFYPSAIFIPLIIALYAYYTKDIKKHNVIVILFLIFHIVHGGIVTYNTLTTDYNSKYNYGVFFPKPPKEIISAIDFLNNNNIKFGYGYHDQVHLINQLTNGKIEGGSAKEIHCNFYKMRWDTRVKYFDEKALNENSYFIVTNRVYNKCKEKNNFLKINKYQYQNQLYTVYILKKGDILKLLK